MNNYSQFAPRSWVMENMNCHLAVKIIHKYITYISKRKNIPYDDSVMPVTKVDFLHGMKYFDEGQEKYFAEDYEYLKKIFKNISNG